MVHININIPLPKLLDSSLKEIAPIPCDKCSISETVTPLSTASMTVYDGPAIKIHDWVQMFHVNGSAGVYRISRIQNTYHTGECAIGLEHGLACLDDAIVKHGNATESDSNNKSTEVVKGTVQACIAHILQYQTVKVGNQAVWRLGTVAVSEEVKANINGTILATLTSIMAELDDYMISCNQTSFPWTINIVAKPTTGIESELRLARNMSTCKINYDDSDMVNRIYCEDLSDSTYPNGYMESANSIQAFGLVEGYHKSDNSDEDAEATCRKLLRWHDHPKVSITVDAVDIFNHSHVTIDKLVCGTRGRIALPDYGVTVEEQIVKLNYKDIYKDPLSVTVYMANEMQNASGAVASASRSARDTKTQIQKVKSEVKLKASQEITKDLFTQITGSEIQINPDGTLNLSAWNTIKNELGIQSITNALIKLNGPQGTIQSKVSSSDLFGETGVWESLGALAAGIGQIEYDATNNRYVFKNGAGLYVQRQEQGQQVNVGIFDAGGNLNSGLVVEAVNGGTTKILGSHIQIGNSDAETVINGKVTMNQVVAKIGEYDFITADQLEAEIADFVDTWSESIQAGSVACNTVSCGTVDTDDLTVGAINGTSIGVHTLSNGTDSVSFIGTGDITFNRAAAQREGVNSVYISPSDIILSDSDYNLNGGSPYYDVEIEASTTSSLFPTLSDTATQSIRVNATSAYNDGVSAGYSSGYSAGVAAGKLEGWNAAAAVSGVNSNNSASFPKSGAYGSVITKVPSITGYVASSYTKESVSYTRSYHSYTASSYTKETTVNRDGVQVLVSGSSYTKESHSYSPSYYSYTGSSYTASTKGSITWS